MAGRLPNKGRGPSSSPTWGWREQGGEASRAQQQCRARPPPPHPGGAGSGSGGGGGGSPQPRDQPHRAPPLPPGRPPRASSPRPSPNARREEGPVTSRPRREGRRPAHITSSAPPPAGQAGGQWTAERTADWGRVAGAGHCKGAACTRPAAIPADGRPGPARRRRAARPGPAPLLQVGWAGGARGGRAAPGPGDRAAREVGCLEQRRRRARNVAGTRPHCGVAGMGAQESPEEPEEGAGSWGLRVGGRGARAVLRGLGPPRPRRAGDQHKPADQGWAAACLTPPLLRRNRPREWQVGCLAQQVWRGRPGAPPPTPGVTSAGPWPRYWGAGGQDGRREDPAVSWVGWSAPQGPARRPCRADCAGAGAAEPACQVGVCPHGKTPACGQIHGLSAPRPSGMTGRPCPGLRACSVTSGPRGVPQGGALGLAQVGTGPSLGGRTLPACAGVLPRGTGMSAGRGGCEWQLPGAGRAPPRQQASAAPHV